MKTFLLSISIMFLLVGCQVETSQEIVPELAKVAGKWKLYKIIGFRITPEPITSEEIIEFNVSTKVFTRTVAGKITETTSFVARTVSNFNNTSARDAIVFTKSNTYSFIIFEENNSSLILNQSTPIGEELADGISYYYRKVQ
jgi:hypothetical protein